jgi:hypothetical protein
MTRPDLLSPQSCPLVMDRVCSCANPVRESRRISCSCAVVKRVGREVGCHPLAGKTRYGDNLPFRTITSCDRAGGRPREWRPSPATRTHDDEQRAASTPAPRPFGNGGVACRSSGEDALSPGSWARHRYTFFTMSVNSSTENALIDSVLVAPIMAFVSARRIPSSADTPSIIIK